MSKRAPRKRSDRPRTRAKTRPRDVALTDAIQPSAQNNLLDDALLVHEVLRSCISKGIYRDPFGVFNKLNPEWTRERWDRAKAQFYGDVLLAEEKRASKKTDEDGLRPKHYAKRQKPTERVEAVTQMVSIGPTSLHSALDAIVSRLPNFVG